MNKSSNLGVNSPSGGDFAAIKNVLYPASGIRDAQLSEAVGNEYFQKLMARNLAEPVSKLPLQLFNNNEEK